MQTSRRTVRALSAIAVALLVGVAPAIAQEGHGQAHEAEVEKTVENRAHAVPTIVKIHADWCGKCAAIDPAWKRVEKELDEDARVVVFDVTDKKTTRAAAALAKEIGFGKFFAQNKTKTGLVAVFPPGETENPSEVLVAEKDFDPYREALAAATPAE